MSISIKFIIVLIVFLQNALSQQNASDLYSTQNLYGMRSFAMSGSNVAVFNHSDDLFINPASVKFEEESINLNFQPYILDTYFYHLNYSQLLSDDYSLIYALSGYVSNDFELRGVDGVKNGSYSNNEMIFSFTAINHTINKNLQIGITSKLINSKLYNYTSNAALIDFGIFYEFDGDFDAHKIALAYTDVPIYLSKYKNSEEAKRKYLSLGYSYRFSKIPIIFAFNNKSSSGLSTINQYGLIFDLENVEFNISFNGEIQDSFEKDTEREVLNGFSFGLAIEDDFLNYSFAYRSLSDLGNHFAFGLSKTLN